MKPSKSLFKQYNEAGTQDLQHWHDTFIEAGDPTEYIPALALAGSWEEWERIKREWAEFGDKILPRWHVELEVRIRSEAIRALCDKARGGDTNAAKFIAERKYNPAKAGRPSKAEIAKAAKVEAELDKEAQAEYDRVAAVVPIRG